MTDTARADETQSTPSTPGGRLLLIDGHSMAFRAFYALPVESMSTGTGQPTNAVYGFTSMLLNLVRTEQPTHIAVAFDMAGGTFRTQEYPEYKATRDATPEGFKGQVELIQALLDAVGITWVEKPDYEADDIIATYATTGEADGMQVLICSGDRDSFQLIDDDVTVLYPVKGVSQLARMTPEAVTEKYGVPPERYSDLAALVGETSDNLPGVPKVGPKTAAKWIGAHGDLQGVIAAAASIPGVVGQNLRDHLPQVELNRRLNALVRDLDLPAEVGQLQPRPGDPEAIHAVCDLLGFDQLRDRILRQFGSAAAGAETVSGEPAVEVETRALGGQELADWLAADAAATALDIDGQLRPGGGDAWRVTLARSVDHAVTVDLTTLDETGERALAAWLADAGRPKIVADAKAARHELAGRGFALDGVEFDVSLAAYLAHPGWRRYDVPELSQRLLGRGLEASDPSGQGALDLGDSVEADAGRRVTAIVELAQLLRTALADAGGEQLLADIELPLTRVLADMEQAGIAIDAPALTALDDELGRRAEIAAQAAYDAIGRHVNLGSPMQLQEVLFEQLEMPKTKKTKRGYTTDADALAELFVKTGHPFLEHLLAHRDATKLRQMVVTLEKSVADDGRIHTTFGQTVAATGRLSSADPNLQNIPIRTDTGRRIREAFVVGEGYECLLTADYSQIEMRIMAHLSGDEGLIAAFNSGEDLHSFVASMVFGVPPAEVTGQMRSRIKAMSYGLAYGLSPYGLSRQLGITTSEASALMEQYFERFGGIRDFLHGVVVAARRTGFTETIFGRRRYLPDLTSDQRQQRDIAERMALNAPIQGSAADIIKIAMLRVDEALAAAGLRTRMLLQVHDELVLEVAPGELDAARELLVRCMGQAAQLRVPLDVSTGVGRTWDEAGH